MADLLANAAPIFIIDDASEDLLLLERVLHHCKILNPVVSCASGDECIAELEKALKMKPPVLMLLDLIMAPMSGLDILHAMNKQGCIKTIPVVMLSGIRDIHAVREGYQLGAQTFLIKPVSMEDILEVVSNVPRICVDEVPGGYLLQPTLCPASEREAKRPFFKVEKSAAFPA